MDGILSRAMPATRAKSARPAMLLAGLIAYGPAVAQDVRNGAAAYGDWRTDAPGVVRRITPDDMPEPYVSESVSRFASVIARPQGAAPQVPPGFQATLFASGFDMPRAI